MRRYNFDESATFIDRIVCSLSYLSFGLVGFVWIIIGFLMKKNLKTFVAYHVYQSIFLSILLYIIQILFSIIIGFIDVMPFVGPIFVHVVHFFTNPVYFFGLSLINLFLATLVIYLAIGAFFGKYVYIPWISDIINSNVRR